MKTWSREMAAGVMLAFWGLVLRVTMTDFPEAGVQLIGVLVAPVFLLVAAAFGLKSFLAARADQ
jgi:hypothetical protein